MLVAPAAANAATYTVNTGDGSCGGADLACGGLAEAAAAPAASGDIINMSPGIYSGGKFTNGGITINGATGVLVNGTVEFAGAGGGVSRMSRVNVVQTAATGAGVLVTGASGLELSDAVVVSGFDHGIFVSAGSANKILRTVVATGGAGSSALRVESSPGVPVGLLVSSVLTSGGAQGIGAFSKAALPSSAGDITLTLRHVTAAGSTEGIVLDSSAGVFGLASGGSIAATMTDSIAFPNRVKNQPGLLGLASNTATLTAPAARNITDPGTDKTAIFAAPASGNYRLRPGSTAIGKGSIESGESTTDIDGEDRSAAPTDFGGDEFVNAPPVAKVVVKTATPRATQAVVFDGGGSTDREASYGGGIVSYQWTYSDGATETTTTPTTSHVFAKEGDAGAQLVVVDRQGAASAPVTVALKLIDGTPPTVAIVKPKKNQKIKVFTTTTKTVDGKKTTTRKRTKIVFSGLSGDKSGVAQIALTLEKSKPAGSTSTRCLFFDPKKGVVSKSCQKPVLFLARLKKDSKTGEWSYTVKRNLGKGKYKLTAVGVDKTGAFGNAGGAKLGVVKFRLI
ncbi:MAG TPA: PKD domain-containing protein [Solirubrobacteraceae bacterium]|nr:PKD domain-containing protein [Solirubrobacteraceae bacterium]